MQWIWIGVKGAYKSRRRMLKEEGTGQIYGLVHGQTRRSARIWALEEKAHQLSLQRRTHKPPPSPSALESKKKRRGRKRKSLLLYMGVNSVAPPMNQKVCLPPFFAFTFKKNILLTNLSVLYIFKKKTKLFTYDKMNVVIFDWIGLSYSQSHIGVWANGYGKDDVRPRPLVVRSSMLSYIYIYIYIYI